MSKEKNISHYLNMLRENEIYYEVSRKLIEDTKISREKQYYYCIWAPIVTEYAKWVLKSAIKDGVERLYFLARDSYPTYIVAKALSESDDNLKIECKYLRVSRQSVRVPEGYLIGNEILDMIFLSGIDVTFRKICKRARLTKSEIEAVATELSIDDVDSVLNRRDIENLRKSVADCGFFMEFVTEHARATYDSIIVYFHQEGLFEDKSIAVVDSGWVGTIQRSIERLVKSAMPNKEVRGYYFGLYEIPQNADPNKYKCFFFEPTKKMFRKYHFSNCFFEAIYSENMPMTVGYAYEGDAVKPVFSNAGVLNKERNETNVSGLNEWVQEYLKECARDKSFAMDSETTGTTVWVQKMLKSVMSNPDQWEAQHYGTYMFSDDVDDTEYKNIAPIMNRCDIDSLRPVSKILVMLGLSQRTLHESAWIEGSCVRSDGYGLRAMRESKFLTIARQQVKQICLKR